MTSKGPRFLEGFHFLLNSVDKQTGASADIPVLNQLISIFGIRWRCTCSPAFQPSPTLLGRGSLACVG